MKSSSIVIGKGVTCDLSRLVATRLLVQASSGAGKSWLLRRLLEQSHGQVQQIVIDPEGEFASLREKYDYVLAARVGGDTLADPRTAKLLAERLLEVRVSAILDIYELQPHERVRFVRFFLEALVDSPKALWHPVLVVLDEAHVYAPETGEAESANAVKGLCSRGRKRGFCAVLATQRLSKLAKDAAAELNNKLIGRTSLDVDMARAGDELGFTKADRLTLRDLDDGEFFAFGPALSRVVTKVRVGGVETKHPKIGGLAAVVPPPSQRIRELLPKLSDLPAEAEAREQTVAELKKALGAARRELTLAKQAQPKVQTKMVEKPVLQAGQLARVEAVVKQLVSVGGEVTLAAKVITDALTRIAQTSQSAETSLRVAIPWDGSGPSLMPENSKKALRSEPLSNGNTVALPPGELAILTAIVQYPGLDRSRLSVLVGYRRSSRDAYIGRLVARGYVLGGPQLNATIEGRRALGTYEPLPTGHELIEFWRRKLPDGERKLFDALLRNGPTMTREAIREVVPEYKRSSSDAYLQRLKARGIITDTGRGVVSLAESIQGG